MAVEISVLISTFYRNELLEPLLRACPEQREIDLTTVEFVIVDNSTEAVARNRVDMLVPQLPITIRYFHEPRRGLANARNRALREAQGQWLVFIDDDEVPRNDWLATLWTTAVQYEADAVFGPVLTELMPSDSDYREEAARFYAQGSSEPTGTPMVEPTFFNRRFRKGVCTRVTASNNCIFRKAASDALGPDPVDVHTSQYGASDQVFFSAMRAKGYGRFIWCADAIVTEAVPPDRQTREYILNRSFRHGQMASNLALTVRPRRYDRLLRSIGLGLAQAGVGAALSCTLPISRRLGFRGQRLLTVGLGRIAFFGPFRRHLYGSKPQSFSSH